MKELSDKEFEYSLFMPMFGAIGPFLIWPIEFFLPYPYIFEEIYKAIFVYLLMSLPGFKIKIKLAVIFALLFAISETVFYFFNILVEGEYQTAFLRLAMTAPMHILTTLIILLSSLKDKRFIVGGILMAGIIHYLYNEVIRLF